MLRHRLFRSFHSVPYKFLFILTYRVYIFYIAIMFETDKETIYLQLAQAAPTTGQKGISQTTKGDPASNNPANDPGNPSPSPFMQLLFPVLFIVVLYFLLLRPQQKKEKNRQKMLRNLAKGDKIVSKGGIIGTVTGLQDSKGIAMVKIADKVNIEMSINAIELVNPGSKEQIKNP